MGRNEDKKLTRGYTDSNVVPGKAVKPSLWRSRTWHDFCKHADQDGIQAKKELHKLAVLQELEENAIGEIELKHRSEKLDNLLHGKMEQPAPIENEPNSLLGSGTMLNTPMQAENAAALKQAEAAVEERQLELSHSHIGLHSMLSRSQTLSALMHGHSSSESSEEINESVKSIRL